MENNEDEKQVQQNRPAAKSQKRCFALKFIALQHIPILGNEKTAPKLIQSGFKAVSINAGGSSFKSVLRICQAAWSHFCVAISCLQTKLVLPIWRTLNHFAPIYPCTP